MCDLTSWAHIWCVSGFVLKTRCYTPSMPTLDVLFEPISQPILDPDDPSYALSPKSHDDPRNPLRQLKYRNHEDRKDDQEEQR